MLVQEILSRKHAQDHVAMREMAQHERADVDEKGVIVDQHHKGTMRALEKWGFEPIPCEFLHYAAFGGAFHCATLDIRRRGTLESYF